MNRYHAAIVNIGSGLVTLPLVISGFSKLTLQANMIVIMQAMGYGNFTRAIGVLELLTAVCFAVPLTRGIGFFLLNAYLGGAVAAELASDSTQVLMPLFMLGIGWVLMLYDEPRWFLRGLYKAPPD